MSASHAATEALTQLRSAGGLRASSVTTRVAMSKFRNCQNWETAEILKEECAIFVTWKRLYKRSCFEI